MEPASSGSAALIRMDTIPSLLTVTYRSGEYSIAYTYCKRVALQLSDMKQSRIMKILERVEVQTDAPYVCQEYRHTPRVITAIATPNTIPTRPFTTSAGDAPRISARKPEPSRPSGRP